MAYFIDESLSDTDFTPAQVVALAFGTPRRYESITVHHWGSFGQTHDGVIGFFMKPNSPTSCHFVASDSRIHCLVSPLDASWAAGNAYGNATSIHIEARPEATDGDYSTVAWLIRHLRSIYGDLPLKPHSAWTATACPGKWDLARLDRMARENPTPTPAPQPPRKGIFMSLTPEQEQKILQGAERALRYLDTKISHVPMHVWNTPVRRTSGNVSALQELADAKSEAIGLRNVLKQVAENQGVPIDYDRVAAAVKAGMVDGIKIEGLITTAGDTGTDGAGA